MLHFPKVAAYASELLEKAQHPECLKKLQAAMRDGNIKTITGLRRSGKTTLLSGLFEEHLKSTGVQNENIFSDAVFSDNQ